jgi:hypothetical protein
MFERHRDKNGEMSRKHGNARYANIKSRETSLCSSRYVYNGEPAPADLGL